MTDPVVNYDHAEPRERLALAGNVDMYHAFLDGLEFANATQTEDAKNRFVSISNYDPEAVAACEGMSEAEARAAFLAIEERMRNGDVT